MALVYNAYLPHWRRKYLGKFPVGVKAPAIRAALLRVGALIALFARNMGLIQRRQEQIRICGPFVGL